MRTTIKVVLCLLALAGALYLFAYPARTYLAQRRQIVALGHTVSVLGTENHKLSAKLKQFHQDATIERIARTEYGFVLPGQQAYAVLPPATPSRRDTGRSAKAPRSKPWYSPLEFWHHL